MPWFKVDDKHHDHKKTRKALRGVAGKRRDAGAMGLWELAGSWSADNLQDGFVPTDELFRWDDDWEELAARLVAAEYWEPAEKDGEEGFQFINWEEHQPMKADVEAKREAAKERMRNLRSGSRSRSSEVRANKQENLPRSDAGSSPAPSRPDPTRPDREDNNVPEADASDAPKSLAPIERQDVEQVCEHLAAAIEANGSKRPEITKRWRDAARLMLDKDGRGIEEIHGAIDWCQRDEFWRANVLSMPTLREKFDQLRLQAQRGPKGIASRADEWKSMQERQMARAIEREREMGIR